MYIYIYICVCVCGKRHTYIDKRRDIHQQSFDRRYDKSSPVTPISVLEARLLAGIISINFSVEEVIYRRPFTDHVLDHIARLARAR